MQVRSMVDLSAIASSPVPIGCTSDSVCRKCFHGTIVLKEAGFQGGPNRTIKTE